MPDLACSALPVQCEAWWSRFSSTAEWCALCWASPLRHPRQAVALFGRAWQLGDSAFTIWQSCQRFSIVRVVRLACFQWVALSPCLGAGLSRRSLGPARARHCACTRAGGAGMPLFCTPADGTLPTHAAWIPPTSLPPAGPAPDGPGGRARAGYPARDTGRQGWHAGGGEQEGQRARAHDRCQP